MTNLPINGESGRTASPHSWVKCRIFVLMQVVVVVLILLLVLLLVSLLVSSLVLLLVCCWYAAGVLPTSTATLLYPVPYSVASRATTLKQISRAAYAPPNPARCPHTLPRAPRPVKIFLDQLNKRSLLPATVTLRWAATERQRANDAALTLLRVVHETNMSLGLCQAPTIVGSQYI